MPLLNIRILRLPPLFLVHVEFGLQQHAIPNHMQPKLSDFTPLGCLVFCCMLKPRHIHVHYPCVARFVFLPGPLSYCPALFLLRNQIACVCLMSNGTTRAGQSTVLNRKTARTKGCEMLQHRLRHGCAMDPRYLFHSILMTMGTRWPLHPFYLPATLGVRRKALGVRVA